MRGNPTTVRLTEEEVLKFNLDDKVKYLYPRFEKLLNSIGLSPEGLLDEIEEWVDWKQDKALGKLKELKPYIESLNPERKKKLARDLGILP